MIRNVRDSDGTTSLNERSSIIEEGHVNQISSAINQGKSMSSVIVEEEARECELPLCDFDPENVCQSFSSGRSGTDSGRRHSGIKSIIKQADSEDDQETPFGAQTSAGGLKKQTFDFEEDCNAGDLDEEGPQHIYQDQTLQAIKNKNKAPFGQSFK